ncbi:MAG: HPr family phosphocarrier protein [Planctomycetaceae bacterium]|nr:HPr family phosphocarrier protein [Planctomycetaceae bacterium]
MPSIQFDINNPSGLHTRPGTTFVRLAKTFSSEIRLRKGDKTANAKSLVKLLQLGISQGDTVMLTCEGEDESVAVDQLSQFIAQLKD